MTTNQELIKSQESQKKFELSFQRKEADRAEFRKLSFEYISTVKLTLKFLLIKLSNIEDESWAYLVLRFSNEVQQRLNYWKEAR